MLLVMVRILMEYVRYSTLVFRSDFTIGNFRPVKVVYERVYKGRRM